MNSGKYYILSLNRDNNGNVIRQDLFGSPNGTPFYMPPIHINTAKDVIVCWANNNAEYYDLKHATVIPTDITKPISITLIAKGLGISEKYITRNNQNINNFLVNIFKDYAPHIDLS